MFRYLLGEQKRVEKGIYADTVKALNRYSDQAGEDRALAIKIGSFSRSLDELEQSLYAAERFSKLVRSKYFQDLGGEELHHYHLHLYFYKNALLRIFSILDKLGSFLDEQHELNTSAVKSRFSYFTVLRHLEASPELKPLAKKLGEIKHRYKEEMDVLRKERNMETHLMNTELLDDLFQAVHAAAQQKMLLEDRVGRLQTLQKGYEMVCLTLQAAFSD
ncbi:Cthe_2314 family HEPN domain-containing protein [Paenibacillus senegalensis]|uniref:Cthe_2314 family HEPN domain-containing protein n=1 Tax=Paenibacillus senegalensis TaxID=1465766 RepID=UPI00028903BB|nr:Cthe_2314 family HEPN domain-containing protein [Paenibacillus senegalensis]